MSMPPHPQRDSILRPLLQDVLRTLIWRAQNPYTRDFYVKNDANAVRIANDADDIARIRVQNAAQKKLLKTFLKLNRRRRWMKFTYLGLMKDVYHANTVRNRLGRE